MTQFMNKKMVFLPPGTTNYRDNFDFALRKGKSSKQKPKTKRKKSK